jgi:hypothetical protein
MDLTSVFDHHIVHDDAVNDLHVVSHLTQSPKHAPLDARFIPDGASLQGRPAFKPWCCAIAYQGEP